MGCRPLFRQCVGMIAGAVPHIAGPAIAGADCIEPPHFFITRLFRGKGGNGNAERPAITLDQRCHGESLLPAEHRKWRGEVAVNKQRKRTITKTKFHNSSFHRCKGGEQDAHGVNLGGAHRCGGKTQDSPVFGQMLQILMQLLAAQW